jgi:hypothetical protein
MMSTDSLLDGVAGVPWLIIIIPLLPPTGPPCAGFMPLIFIEFIAPVGVGNDAVVGNLQCSNREIR